MPCRFSKSIYFIPMQLLGQLWLENNIWGVTSCCRKSSPAKSDRFLLPNSGLSGDKYLLKYRCWRLMYGKPTVKWRAESLWFRPGSFPETSTAHKSHCETKQPRKLSHSPKHTQPFISCFTPIPPWYCISAWIRECVLYYIIEYIETTFLKVRFCSFKALCRWILHHLALIHKWKVCGGFFHTADWWLSCSF